MAKSEKTFYAVETVKFGGQFLCEVEEDIHETMIRTTTKNIHNKNIMEFENKDDAMDMADAIKNDAYSVEPSVVRITVKTEIEGV